MGVFLFAAVLTVVVQLSQLQPLDYYKKAPMSTTSLYTLVLTFCITASGVIGFGLPYSPIIISALNLVVMLVVIGKYPGLVLEIEKMSAPIFLGGLSIEYFVNGHFHAPRNWPGQIVVWSVKKNIINDPEKHRKKRRTKHDVQCWSRVNRSDGGWEKIENHRWSSEMLW